MEAEWQSTGYFPTLEEYLDNGWISVSGHVLLTHFFCLSRQTKETMQCLKNYPNFFRSSSIIFRLCNDLATSAVSISNIFSFFHSETYVQTKFKQISNILQAEIARGDAPTSVACYMHEHGVTEEVAREELKKLISETWKMLNKEVADCDSFPRSLAIAAINLARISHCTYHKGDGIGAPDKQKKNHIKSILFEPIKVTGKDVH